VKKRTDEYANGPEARMLKKSKLGSCCGGGCVTFVLLGLIVYLHNSTVPNIKIPPRQLPSQNAFATFNQAQNLLVDDRKIKDAYAPPKNTAPVSLAEKRRLVSENKLTLATVREGLQLEYMDPSPRSPNATFPYFKGDRSLAFLLALDANVNAEDHKYGAAANSSLDAMQLGNMIPRGSVLIGKLVGIACEAIGRKQINKIVDQLSPAEARAAVKRLEDMRAKSIPFHETLQEEKYMTLSGLMAMLNAPQSMNQFLGSNESENRGPEMMLRGYLMLHSKETIVSDCTRYMDENIENHRKAYPHPAKPMPEPKGPILSIFLPVFSQSDFKDQENRALDDLLMLRLALRAFRVEHGHYPASLQELKGSYLTDIPEDPFAAAGAYKYAVNGDKFTLYSIGPDGKDDGGRAIDDPARAKDGVDALRYTVMPDSKGDIVAGVNVQ
jgi:type II secretory pathway pseudopilin PulG